MAINVFLIEHQTIIREGIMALIGLDENLCIVGSAENYSARSPELNNQVDVILLELSETSNNPVNLVKEILNDLPTIKIIILSGHDDSPVFLKEVFEAGVSGYMTKNASAKELTYGIDKVTRDGLYICTAFMLKFIKNIGLQTEPVLDLTIHTIISAAEMEVLILVAEGLTNNDIAQKLCVSVRTIETRRYKLLEKTNTNNTASLIRYSMRTGLIK